MGSGREAEQSSGLDGAEVGVCLLPNSSFFGSCPRARSALPGKGCSGQLHPSGHEQEGAWGRGIQAESHHGPHGRGGWRWQGMRRRSSPTRPARGRAGAVRSG